MITISDILTPERIRCSANASSKKKALELIAETIANTTSFEARDIFDGLVSRERLGSTGIGHGIAIPHSRLDNVTEPIGCFILLQTGVEYQAEDNLDVDLLFALIVPIDATEAHLQLLGAIAKIFRNETFVTKLRKCTSREEIFERLIHA